MKVKLFYKLSIRLFIATSLILILIFSLHTYITIRNLEQDITKLSMQSAFNISDLIKRSTRYSMLLNKRDDIYQIINTIGTEPGVKRIRIYNKQGVITYSTDHSELLKTVDMTAEACIVCHDIKTKAFVTSPSDSIRIFTVNGERVLGVINPIFNEPDCYNSGCHAHNPKSKLTGVLDVMVSMRKVDETISTNTKNIIITSLLITIFISAFSGAFILFLVNKPLKKLQKGITELGKGNWNYRIGIRTKSELGVIAREFDEMSKKLSQAYKEIKDWSETLNIKVEDKSKELKRIYEQIVQIEKLASLGKLSATVAHELNNPLEGILTYSKLIIKKLKNKQDDNTEKIINYLTLISEESARCGKIVKDLLLFSHRDTGEYIRDDLIKIINKSEMLISHHLEMNNVQLIKDYKYEYFEITCHPQKIQQALISLLINAIEAMSTRGGGKIRITLERSSETAVIRIIDQGTGIDEKDLSQIFEPFFTTKESVKGTGLGLAVVFGIINSHRGKIEVEKSSTDGTTFKITLPLNQN